MSIEKVRDYFRPLGREGDILEFPVSSATVELAAQALGVDLSGVELAVLSHGDAYGYILTQQVKGKLDISESTLYPVLRRLQRDGLLTVYDRPYQGRNRRYYAITPVGRTQLERRREEWKHFRDGVDEIMKEDEQHG